jgi:hypothetical protein
MNDLLAQLGPDGIAQLMSMGALDDQQAMLDAQLQQAQALRQRGPEQYGPLGAGLQGAADVLNAYTSQRDQRAIRGQQHAILGQQTATRRQLADALLAPPPAKPETPFGLGPAPRMPGGPEIL